MKTRSIEELKRHNERLLTANKNLRSKDVLMKRHNRTLKKQKETHVKIIDKLTKDFVAEKEYCEQLQSNFNLLALDKLQDAMQDLKMYREYYVESVSRGA